MWELPSFWSLASHCVMIWSSQDNQEDILSCTAYFEKVVLSACYFISFGFIFSTSPTVIKWNHFLLRYGFTTHFFLYPFAVYTNLIDFVFTSNFSILWQKYTSSHAQVLPFICTVCLFQSTVWSLKVRHIYFSAIFMTGSQNILDTWFDKWILRST